ncbi:hypothetical protein OPV22_002667 [Ensete ventricosum]|uniref:CLAVATA3/ESR-related protein n=1 Tax=Ensete ventricosum TaxID=4639 RepID=A0AAV8RYK4_ENSVE|nr:hypothetical protein OPV22_002667 [Ensete ventricosum]
MRLQHFPLPHMVFFLLLLLLVAGQLASLNHARTVSREVEEQKSEHSAPSMGQFPKISPSQEHDDDEFSQTYGVSKRLVPQGPNPLHN